MLSIPKIRTTKLRVMFRAAEAGELPAYLGSTIRGVLGHAMRGLVCVRPRTRCHLCELAQNCSYAYHFNSPGNVAGSVNPFVLHVPTRYKTDWLPGDLLTFDITIFGSSTEAIDYYIDGFFAMEKRGWGINRLKFSLVEILHLPVKQIVRKNGNANEVTPNYVEGEVRETNRVMLNFISPTRIIVQRQLQKDLSFQHIVRSIMTRLQLIAHAYEGIIVDWDEAMLLARASEVRTVEANWRYVNFKRYSLTHHGKISLPAIEGYASFEGELTPFTALLEVGKTLQIGKNSTHGFGKYDLYYG